MGLLETPKKDSHWTLLDGTIPGSPHYPDACQTSGAWTLGPHLPVEKGSSRFLELHTSQSPKIKTAQEVPPQKQMTSWGGQLSQDHGSGSLSPRWKLYAFCCLLSAFSPCLTGSHTMIRTSQTTAPTGLFCKVKTINLHTPVPCLNLA